VDERKWNKEVCDIELQDGLRGSQTPSFLYLAIAAATTAIPRYRDTYDTHPTFVEQQQLWGL
jgi:hypothetical protein